MKTKGLIYYTDFNLDPHIHEVCLRELHRAFYRKGEVVSVSLNKPLEFGQNIVIQGERSNTMMTRQILEGLENLKADIVFFTEHDVLYNSTHFDFTPPKEDVFYYNVNTWRWDYPHNRAISYNELTSLSHMCADRKWALDHYRKRLKRILDEKWDQEDGIGKMQPKWIRALGYEPGTKRRRIGGFSDDVSERWRSETPNVDIRHGTTLSHPKTRLESFIHPPTGWQEVTIDKIPNWDLKKLFDLDLDA